MVLSQGLRRLISPRSIVVVGGDAAEEVVRQCQRIGFSGDIWPVHPRRPSLAGVPCLPDLSALPEVPDASFVSVSADRTVKVVAELAALGVGGAVCHASGFAEEGPAGAALQRELVAAAGEMAVVGPNCLGMLNYLDGVALWCDQHGGARVERGVAVITQSGNLGVNLTMQRRSLPLAALVAAGNCAVTGIPDLVAAMLEDDRVTAIGLYLEDLPDVEALSRVALEALRRQVPIVALTSGTSSRGARTVLSHTGSLATSDVLTDALFRKLGIARVHRVEAFVETLKLLHVHGALPGARITSASCSGGEAAHVADLAEDRGVTLPDLPAGTADRLRAVLGERVAVDNPLDYHTYIWGDRAALTSCFTALLGAEADVHLLLLDLPRADRCVLDSWDATLAAFQEAQEVTGARACVVSSLPEALPEAYGAPLLALGIAPMQGIGDCLAALAAARDIGAAQAGVSSLTPLLAGSSLAEGPVDLLDEAEAKDALAAFGVPVPVGSVVSGSAGSSGSSVAASAGRVAAGLGFPVVVKALSSSKLHKTEVGGVRLGLRSDSSVVEAVEDMGELAERFLVERMVAGAVVELLVGVRQDAHFGMTLTLGAGGVLVELLDDASTVLLPATPEEIRAALESLRVWPLLSGYRGPAADVEAVVAAVQAIIDYARSLGRRLVEVEVNPLLALRDGVVAVDAVVRLSGERGEVPR